MKYRVRVLENPESTEYLVDKIVKSRQTPRAIVGQYLKLYPDAYQIEAKEDTPHRLYSYSISSNPN